jgi:hypothetical protein
MSAVQQVPSAKRFLSKTDISECMTYRDAVRLAFKNRSRPYMTQERFAEELGTTASNMSRYLDANPLNSRGVRRPDLPAELIPKAEEILGNHAISQYLTRLGMLTLMEEVIAQRTA